MVGELAVAGGEDAEVGNLRKQLFNSSAHPYYNVLYIAPLHKPKTKITI